MKGQMLLNLVITALTLFAAVAVGADNCGSLSSDCQCNVECCFKVNENSLPLTTVGRLDQTPILNESVVSTILQSYLTSNRSLIFDFQNYEEADICNSNENINIPLSDWLNISNSSTGTISTVQMLDSDYYRELCMTDKSCFTVFALVSYSEPLNVNETGTHSFLVNIDLVDLNDNKPQFEYTLLTNSTVFTQSIIETQTTEMQLFCSTELLATDKDAHPSINYSVTPSSVNFSVELFGETQLCVTNHIALDRESIDNISFTITAQNIGADSDFSSELTVLLILIDINDNDPVLNEPISTQLNVLESTTVGTVIDQYLATDQDNGTNAAITYSLSSTSMIPFAINSSTGVLYVNETLDADTEPSMYSFTVIATDGDGAKDQLSITVDLVDVNDNPPTFSVITKHYVEFSEGPISSDSKIIVSIFIEDKDKTSSDTFCGFVTEGYEFASVSKTFFSIGGTNYLSNLQFIVDELDYESVNEIFINYTISDGGNPELTASTYIVVNVTDVNDNEPNLTKTEFCGNESELPGTVLFFLEDYFTDADSDANGNNKPGKFCLVNESDQYYIDVDPKNGAVMVKNTLDRESIPNGNITFEVLIMDQGVPPLNSTKSIVIIVTDENDNKPMFSEPIVKFYIPESNFPQLNIGQVQATDNDIGLNADIRYRLVTSSLLFVIDNITGNISSVGELDRETESEYNLTVVAEDQGVLVVLSSSINVTIIITDINDNDPEFMKNITTTFMINSTTIINTEIGQLPATDSDINENAVINYKMEANNLFDINNSGILYTTRNLEMNDVGDYMYDVTAFNTNNKLRNVTSTIQVFVLLINTTAPATFGSLQLYASISAAALVLVIAIMILLCCICCMCYHRKHSRSKDLAPLPPQSTIPKKSSLKIAAVGMMSTKEEEMSINGDVPRSPIVLFSDECQVRYFSQDQSMTKSGAKTETVRFENKFETANIESPQIPTKEVQEMEEVSSPPLSEDLSSNSSLSNSLYQSTSNQYYEHSPKNQHLPLREDTLKKHNEAISENYGGGHSMLYPPQGTGHHDIIYHPPEVYGTNNGHYSHGVVDDNRDDDFDGVDSLPPNIKHYLSSNHHSNQSITAPVSHYVSQNGTPPSTDSSPARIHYMHHMTPHKSLPAVYYSRHHQPHYTIDQPPHPYYEEPPPLQKGLHHYTSSSSSSSNHHRPDLSPPSPPQQAHYPPLAMRHPLPRHGRHSHDRPTIDGHLSPLDEYPHIPPTHHSSHSRTHVTYPHPVLQPPSRLYTDMSRQSFAASEDNSTVASSILDTYLQFETHLPKPDYLLSDAISVDER